MKSNWRKYPPAEILAFSGIHVLNIWGFKGASCHACLLHEIPFTPLTCVPKPSRWRLASSFPFSTFLLFYLHLYPCSQFHKCNNLRIASSSILLISKTTRQKESWHEKHFHKAKLSCDGNLIITIREQNWVYLSPSLFPLGWFLFFVFLRYHHSPLLFCRKELDTRTEIICAYTSCRLSKTLLPLPACACMKKLIWFGEHRTASLGGEAANHAREVPPAKSTR